MTDSAHEISYVRHEAGELSFDAEIGTGGRRVWLRSDPERPTSAEAVLPTCLMPAMSFGGTLDIPVPISPRVLRNQVQFQGIQRAWSLGWDFAERPLREVEVTAPPAAVEPGPGNGRVAAFLSGGVDSWSTVVNHPEITDLIFVRGVDILVDAPHQSELAVEVEARMRGVADELGLGFHAVETNFRQLTDPLIPWDAYFGCALATISLFLAPRFERVLIAGSLDYEVQIKYGGTRLVDQLWSTEGFEIVEDGGRFSRVERTAMIASHPLVQKTLRVCWRNPEGAYNCGRCRKCLMTMVTLEALGALEGVTTFPELDIEQVTSTELAAPVSLTFWEDVLDAVRTAGRADLEPAVEGVVTEARRSFGLPRSYRRRAQPGPLPLDPGKAQAARADRELVARLGNPGVRRMTAELLDSRSWKQTAPLRRARRRT